jgi:threonine/homoserine/homoserine lactone efflux protein
MDEFIKRIITKMNPKTMIFYMPKGLQLIQLSTTAEFTSLTVLETDEI